MSIFENNLETFFSGIFTKNPTNLQLQSSKSSESVEQTEPATPTTFGVGSIRAKIVVIDPQVDFHEGGALAVKGANADSANIASVINILQTHLAGVYISRDSHHPDHIAHAMSWVNENGVHPVPFTLITHDDVATGKWRPSNPDHLSHCLEYTAALMDGGQFTLCIWPTHCIIGSPQQEIVPVVKEAVGLWEASTGKSAVIVDKGQNNLTEMYSALHACYTIPDDPSTQYNLELLEDIANNCDVVIIAGEALSRCINWTVRDMLEYHEWESGTKFILLGNCSSPVAGFEHLAKDFVRWFELQDNTYIADIINGVLVPISAEELVARL
jgi:nicotinamidase/pyrazinamidase